MAALAISFVADSNLHCRRYQLHDHSRKLHTWSKKRRDSWKQRKGHVGDPGSQDTESDEPETTLELENFTEPQVSTRTALSASDR